ncbi:hypothetical protein [Sphingomonas sp.]|uniref:hypothetical protein n=1 Tax=Sphingomonas sp. TaxID=28214 RepID=UPI00286E33B1|nr:hypothetical protein [Sphingomonas sp.]
MRGWSSILIAFFLLALAYWSYAASGLGSSTMAFGAAGAVFFVRGAYGLSAREAGDAGDTTAIIEFVTNPAGAIVDSATDKLGDWLQSDDKKPAADAAPEQPKFDPDAALARYLENRAPAPAAAAPEAAAPPRGFGRKGLA